MTKTPFKFAPIQNISAREILDSRGFPTVEVDLTVAPGVIGRAAVPSGASTGEGEAIELRDGDSKRYQGKGVLKAVGNVREHIAPELLNGKFDSQEALDRFLISLDGTPNKSRFGANAILAVSMAFARAQAAYNQVPLYQYLAAQFGAGQEGRTLPVPLMNIINGGKHADNGLNLQEFMIVPAGFSSFHEALRAGTEVFHHLKKILHDQGLSTAVGDEGGFAPRLPGENPHETVIQTVLKAIGNAGYVAGKDVFLALDSAASEFYDSKSQAYLFEGKKLTGDQMIQVYESWLKKYPIVSIEDGLAEGDWAHWKKMTQSSGSKCQLVGDDLFVTNIEYLKKGIETQTANSILIKLNQIGTVTETIDTMKMAKNAGYSAIVSHRSGETEDTFIADLAVASDCGQIKTGSASRTDRLAKYNQLLRIEEQLGSNAKFSGKSLFKS